MSESRPFYSLDGLPCEGRSAPPGIGASVMKALREEAPVEDGLELVAKGTSAVEHEEA